MVFIERLTIYPNLIIHWGSGILGATLQGAAVFGLVWIILRLFPKIHPTLRCWLWRIVYLKFLVSFLGIEQFKILWFSIPKIIPSSLIRFLNNTGAVSQWISTTEWIPVKAEACNGSPTLNLFLFNQWKFWFIIWVMGVGLFLIRLAFLWLRNWRMSLDLYPVRHPALVKRYAELCAQLKIQRGPRLFWSNSISTPSLQGFIHPKIILPADLLTQYRLEEINLMLAHELAHFKRQDLGWNWLPTLTEGLFFFHPLIWIAGRELKETLEIDCDQQAVQFTGARRVDYGKLLVKATCQPATGASATCRPAARKQSTLESWFLGTGPLRHQTAEFYQPKPKKILKKRLIALDSQGCLQQKWLKFWWVILAFFGVVTILPWKFTPMLGIQMIPPLAVDFNSELSVDVQYVNHFLKFAGTVTPDYVTINNCDVLVDNEPIPIGAKWYNAGGEVKYNTFSGYFLIEDDEQVNKSHQIQVMAKTDTGKLQEKYDFNISPGESSRL